MFEHVKFHLIKSSYNYDILSIHMSNISHTVRQKELVKLMTDQKLTSRCPCENLRGLLMCQYFSTEKCFVSKYTFCIVDYI